MPYAAGASLRPGVKGPRNPSPEYPFPGSEGRGSQKSKVESCGVPLSFPLLIACAVRCCCCCVSGQGFSAIFVCILEPAARNVSAEWKSKELRERGCLHLLARSLPCCVFNRARWLRV